MVKRKFNTVPDKKQPPICLNFFKTEGSHLYLLSYHPAVGREKPQNHLVLGLAFRDSIRAHLILCVGIRVRGRVMLIVVVAVLVTVLIVVI